MDSGLKYDNGRPYYLIPGTNQRSYVSPVAMGTGTRPEGGGGPFKHDWSWDQNKGKWVQNTDWGNLATLGTAIVMSAGAADAAGLLGGAPAVLGPPAPAALGTIGPTAGAGAVGGLAGVLKHLGGAQGIASLAGLLPLLLGGGLGGGGGGGTPGGGQTSPLTSLTPDISALLNMSVNRAQRTDPLHQAVTALAMSRLPTNVQR